MTTFWEGYADRDRDPSWDAGAVRIRVEEAYNKYHYGHGITYVHMAGVFEEAFKKADKKDRAFIRALVHEATHDKDWWMAECIVDSIGCATWIPTRAADWIKLIASTVANMRDDKDYNFSSLCAPMPINYSWRPPAEKERVMDVSKAPTPKPKSASPARRAGSVCTALKKICSDNTSV